MEREVCDWGEAFGEFSVETENALNNAFRAILYETRSKLKDFCDEKEAKALEAISDEVVLDSLLSKTKDLKVLTPSGLREKIRKHICVLIIRSTTQKYSTRNGGDPVVFFNTHLKERMKYFGLPVTSLNEASPNLSRVLRESKRYREISV